MEKERLKTFLAIVLSLVLTTTAFAQGRKVTIKADDMALTAALNQVERQSGYYKLNYDNNQLAKYKVTADIKSKDAVDAVNTLLNGLPLKATVNGRYIQISRGAARRQPQNQPKAQVRSSKKGITGRVTDINGEPMVGAKVAVPGTSMMAVTDIDGKFSLPDASSNDRIEVSYIGKKTVSRKAGSNNLNFVVEDDQNLLNDVMVTGYQRLSRERATGSFDKIGEKELASRPTSDISSALQGLVAGMQATENEDGTVSFKIRGTSSLYADTKPLVVVDGFPIDDDFTTINPNDVESVTVLKDAAAASIWGARSANGVIVVTTKKGANHNGKVKVNGQAFWRLGTRPDIDYVTSQADSRTTVDYELLALKNGYNWGEWMPGGMDAFLTPLDEVGELYYRNKYAGLSEADAQAGYEALRNRSNRKQLEKYLMQQELLQQYNVNISGGTNKFSNYLSLMYEHNDEATARRGYERFMVNYNAQYKLNRNLDLSAGVTWQKRNRDLTGYTVSEFSNLEPYEMLLNDDGSYAYNACYDFSNNVGGVDRLGLDGINTSAFPYSDWDYNMLREMRGRDYKSKTDNLRIQLGADLHIIKGLDYSLKYQYETNRTDTRRMDGEDTYFTRYMVNYYTDYDPVSNTVTAQYLPMGAVLRRNSFKNSNKVLRNQLSYNNTFAEKHDVSAIAGIEMSEYVTSSTIEPYLFGYNPDTNTAPTPYYGSRDNVGNLSNFSYYSRFLFNNMRTTFSERTDRYLSYYFNVGYMYDDRYGVSFSSRWDGSNFVSKDKSLRWSPMWSVGAKWNMGKEEFMKDVDWVDYLNLRATYGLNGNAEKSTSPQTLINVRSNSITYGDIASIASYGNPSLKWEKTKTFNIGADFSLFHNMLSGKVDWYTRRSVDVIGDVSIPSAYGTSTQRFNNAIITNKGVEVELGGHFNVKGIGLAINSTLTYAYNKNLVKELYNPTMGLYMMTSASNGSSSFVEGYPVGAIFCYQYAGTKDGVPYIKNEAGDETPMTSYDVVYGTDKTYLKYMGTTINPHTFSWINEFSWKGITLNIYIEGKAGGKFRSPVPTIPELYNGSKINLSRYITYFTESDYSDHPGLPEPNDYAYYRWQNYNQELSYNVQDASFIRLKELSLSYQLPVAWTRRFKINSLRVFAQARDLGLIWKGNNMDVDPEWLPGTNKPYASYTFGLNIQF